MKQIEELIKEYVKQCERTYDNDNYSKDLEAMGKVGLCSVTEKQVREVIRKGFTSNLPKFLSSVG